MFVVVKSVTKQDLTIIADMLEHARIQVQGCAVFGEDGMLLIEDGHAIEALDFLGRYGITAQLDPARN